MRRAGDQDGRVSPSAQGFDPQEGLFHPIEQYAENWYRQLAYDRYINKIPNEVLSDKYRFSAVS
jgi:hypothetical protein